MSSGLKKLKSSYRLNNGTCPMGEDGAGGEFDGRFTQDWDYSL